MRGVFFSIPLGGVPRREYDISRMNLGGFPMKRFALILAALLLASCGASGQSSLIESQLSSVEASSQSSIPSSEEASSFSSIEETSVEPSSEEEPLPASSEEVEPSSEVSSVEAKEPVTLLPSHFPTMPSNGYPAEQEISVGEMRFLISDVGQGVWKNDASVKTIQMRKQTASIQSLQALDGTLTITAFDNPFHDYQTNEDLNGTVAPTVEVSETIDGPKSALTPLSSQDGDDWIFEYSHSGPAYYWISNLSKYAQYLSEILWQA